MGGGAVAGVTQVELEHQSISNTLNKFGATLSKVFFSSTTTPASQPSDLSFLSAGFSSAFTFLTNLPNQISSAFNVVNPHVMGVINFSKSLNFSDITSGVKEVQIEGKDIKEIIAELGEKQTEVKKIVKNLVEHSSLLQNVYSTVSQNKEDYLQAIKGISEKAGGYKQLLKYALQESTLLTEQLTKLQDQGSTISSKLGNVVKKLNEKKSDIEEITKDLEGSKFTGEGGSGTHIKKNFGDYLVNLSEQSDQLDSGISTLKTQKDKLKKLIGDSGNSIATGLEKKDQLSKSLDLDSSGGVKLSDVFSNLKDIQDDSFSKLEDVQKKMIEKPQAAKLLIKSAGKGGKGFVKVLNNWSKYESLMNGSGSQ